MTPARNKAAACGVDPCRNQRALAFLAVARSVDLQFSAQHRRELRTAADEITHVTSKPAFMLPTTTTIIRPYRTKYLDCG
jgi:hypothetical protein